MNLPEYRSKRTKWQIQGRDLASGAKINHIWWSIYREIYSLEDAKDALEYEKRGSHSPSEEFKIVRVEVTTEYFDEIS
jgi:hypothetical protein